MNGSIIHGDCIAGMASMPAGSVDLVVTSPPYFNARDYSHWDDYSEYLGWMEKAIGGMAHILAKGRFLAMVSSPVIVPRSKRQDKSTRLPIPYDLHGLMDRDAWEFVDDIVWAKPTGAGVRRGGFSVHGMPLAWRPTPVTEMVMVYRRRADWLIDKDIKDAGARAKASRTMSPEDGGNIWRLQPMAHPWHPAVFPIDLAARLVRLYSFEGDTVADPFMGSGTTALAAVRLRRHCIGWEANAEYARWAQEALQAELDQGRLV